MTFDLSRLASKHKRAHDWAEFASREIPDLQERARILSLVGKYREALARCADSGSVSPEDARAIADFERQLVELHDHARLQARPA